jgi:acetyltransferase-like isoleucine patch superfamily enzyme
MIMSKNVYIHPTAIVDTKKVGTNTRIWAFVHILEGASIGINCNICDHCYIENEVVIGNEVTIKSGVYIWDGVNIEDNVFIGPNATFTNDKYPRSKVYLDKSLSTVVKEGASVGAGSVMLPNLIIGRYAMIGAGSVISRSVNDYELVYGNPARRHGFICKCKEELNLGQNRVVKCSCGKEYKFDKKSGKIYELYM